MNQINWVPTIGNIDIQKDIISLTSLPSYLPAGPTGVPQPPYAFIRSNVEFEEGDISFEFCMENDGSACLVGFNIGQQVELYAGVNATGAQYGFSTVSNGQWDFKNSSGFGSQLQTLEWHKLKIHVKGSILDLFIDDVKIVSTSHIVSRSPIGMFLQGEGNVQVKNFEVNTTKRTCFVVMQFSDEYNMLYTDVIKPTCESYGYSVVRADDYYTSGLIIDDITKSIKESALIIADITPDNPNVFYEVGFAHGIDKPTILLSDRKREKLPFDLSGFRTLFYDNSIGGKSIIEERLCKHLDAIVDA